jgi:hypothetical protein
MRASRRLRRARDDQHDGRAWRRCRRRTGRRDEVGILDADYAAAGVTVTADAVNGAEIVLQLRRPQSAERACLNLIYPELTSSRQIPWNASRTSG